MFRAFENTQVKTKKQLKKEKEEFPSLDGAAEFLETKQADEEVKAVENSINEEKRAQTAGTGGGGGGGKRGKKGKGKQENIDLKKQLGFF